jgi:phosphoadenosine phosphosulfate reductase
MVKINPVAAWSRTDVWGYIEDQRLPHNPLYDLGYASIGCAPCTRMHFRGEPERAGRWAGLSKWECGIHGRENAGPVDLGESTEDGPSPITR